MVLVFMQMRISGYAYFTPWTTAGVIINWDWEARARSLLAVRPLETVGRAFIGKCSPGFLYSEQSGLSFFSSLFNKAFWVRLVIRMIGG